MSVQAAFRGVLLHATMLAAAVCCSGTLCAQATDTVAAGDARLARRPLPTGVVTIATEMIRAGNHTAGSSRREVRDTVIGGVRAYLLLTMAGTGQYRLAVRQADLVPIGFAMQTDRDSAELQLSGRQVAGWRANASGREDLQVSLPAAPFQEMLVPDLIARLPLAEGLRVCLYLYHPFTNESCLPLRVVGRGAAPDGLATGEVWTVESVNSTDYGTITRTWWIEVASARPVGERLSAANGTVITSRYVTARDPGT